MATPETAYATAQAHPAVVVVRELGPDDLTTEDWDRLKRMAEESNERRDEAERRRAEVVSQWHEVTPKSAG